MPRMHFNLSAMKSALFALVLLLLLAPQLFGAGEVSISENASSYILENGVVTARVAKRSGDLLSLKYQGLEMLDAGSQRQAGYWSHNTARGQPINRVHHRAP